MPAPSASPSAPPASAPRPTSAALKTPTGPSPAANDEHLFSQFEQVVSQISVRVETGSYVAEHCTMLVEIARISATSNCPAALRERALSLLLQLARRPDGQGPCRRGVQEVLDQCLARGIKR